MINIINVKGVIIRYVWILKIYKKSIVDNVLLRNLKNNFEYYC